MWMITITQCIRPGKFTLYRVFIKEGPKVELCETDTGYFEGPTLYSKIAANNSLNLVVIIFILQFSGMERAVKVDFFLE